MIRTTDSNQKHTQKISIMLLGDYNVGKTSLIYYFVKEQQLINKSQTLGLDYFTLNFSIKKEIVKLILWDTAGQEKYHSIIEGTLKNMNGFVLVYDVTSEKSFKQALKWYQIIQNNTNHQRVILVGNKDDLLDQRQHLIQIQNSSNAIITIQKKLNKFFILQQNQQQIQGLQKEPKQQNQQKIWKKNIKIVVNQIQNI